MQTQRFRLEDPFADEHGMLSPIQLGSITFDERQFVRARTTVVTIGQLIWLAWFHDENRRRNLPIR